MITSELRAVVLSLVAVAFLVTPGGSGAVHAQVAFIPADTEVVIRTIAKIDAREADQNREYAVVLDEPLIVEGTVIAPKGADAVVQVTDANSVRGVSGRASLILQLTAVNVDGRRVAVSTASVKSEGGSQGSRAAKAGIGGAAVGAVLGGLLGGKSGIATGAAIGGGAAVGVVAVAGQHIQVPAETRLTFVLADKAPIERQ
ncbi:MAG TPA: hypothetical protein VMS40_11625 [Vicinamibacterales bacterium]|nr:hypothetical protein [Vicinamibacterales bacterium]